MSEETLATTAPTSAAGPLDRFFGALRLSMMGLGPRDLAPVMRHWADAPAPIAARLTGIVESFAFGYNLALRATTVPEVIAGLAAHDPERRGFAYEGAGMALAIRVQVMPGNAIFREYLAAADDHHYIVQVGAGWAMARVPIRHGALKAQLGPVFHWLAWDGYGFHEAFFNTEATVKRHGGRPALPGYAGPGVDNGVGRALWFVCAADPERVAQTISEFPEARRVDLWGGVGLAAGYAGGVSAETLAQLARLAGPSRPDMGVGTLLALRTRSRAGNLGPHTELAVRALCNGEPQAMLSMVEAEERAAGDGDAAYPRLRERLRAQLAAIQ